MFIVTFLVKAQRNGWEGRNFAKKRSPR